MSPTGQTTVKLLKGADSTANPVSEQKLTPRKPADSRTGRNLLYSTKTCVESFYLKLHDEPAVSSGASPK